MPIHLFKTIRRMLRQTTSMSHSSTLTSQTPSKVLVIVWPSCVGNSNDITPWMDGTMIERQQTKICQIIQQLHSWLEKTSGPQATNYPTGLNLILQNFKLQ